MEYYDYAKEIQRLKRHFVPCNKERHANERLARISARKAMRYYDKRGKPVVIQVYECRKCKQWHLTKDRKQTQEARAVTVPREPDTAKPTIL